MYLSHVESIKINQGQPVALAYHQQRVDYTIGEGKINLRQIFDEQILPTKGIYKARLEYNMKGNHAPLEWNPYHPKSISTLQFIEDATIDYHQKWCDRTDLLRLKQLSYADDIIITQKGLITDTTYSNLAFGDGKNWILTQEILLPGTKRQALIDQGCPVKSISIQSYLNYPYVSLINAMLDPGEIFLPTKNIIF